MRQFSKILTSIKPWIPAGRSHPFLFPFPDRGNYAEKNISQYRLLKSGMDNKTLYALKRNKNIMLLTLDSRADVLSNEKRSGMADKTML